MMVFWPFGAADQGLTPNCQIYYKNATGCTLQCISGIVYGLYLTMYYKRYRGPTNISHNVNG